MRAAKNKAAKSGGRLSGRSRFFKSVDKFEYLCVKTTAKSKKDAAIFTFFFFVVHSALVCLIMFVCEIEKQKAATARRSNLHAFALCRVFSPY